MLFSNPIVFLAVDMSHTEKTLQDMIKELAYLLEKREKTVAGAVAIILDQKVCLHCSRIYLWNG